jgi:hypothetical protein
MRFYGIAQHPLTGGEAAPVMPASVMGIRSWQSAPSTAKQIASR